MKKITLTLCLLLVSYIVFAGKLVLIPVSETHNLEYLFKDKNLKIHYYCDTYVVATAHVVHYNNAVVLDENAFADLSSYAIVHGYEHNKTMIAVRDVEARLPIKSSIYPVITEPDEDVLDYISQVSAGRMMADIQTLQDFVTRDCQHPNIINSRNWIKEQFDALNVEVALHNFPYYNNDNVIAIQYGTEFPDEYVVCGGHYDSKSWFPNNIEIAPGADDNASGTAGILETARILSQYKFKRSIIYCAFSAEEYGLFGSGYYAEQCATQSMNIVGYFNLDMTGYFPPENDIIHIDLVHFISSQPLADYYFNICEVYFPELSVESYYPQYGSSDYASFNNMGYMAIFPHEDYNGYNPYIHSPDDIIGIGVNDPELAALFTKTNVASVATLAVPDHINSITALNPKFRIYPNPTTGELIISPAGGELRGWNNGEWAIDNIEILDVYGRKQSSNHQITLSSNHKINISHLPAGIYIIKIANEFAGKFIKQ